MLAGLLLLCFTIFGKVIATRKARNREPSASSNTRVSKDVDGKRKKKKGPPPSSQLKPVDVQQLATHESAPDDIKELMAKTGKMPDNRSDRAEFYQLSKISENPRQTSPKADVFEKSP